MRRWIYRISIGLLIAVVAVIAVVQVVLWSPLPRRMVIQQIENQLGLRIQAASLSTGWLGHSELTNVSLGLPLSNENFLKVKSLKIHHSNLIMLALGQLEVKSVEIDNPQVAVVQGADGEWNLQQVVVLLGRLGGSKTTQTQATSTGIPSLPIVKLVNGSVQVTDNQKHSVTLSPLNISGYPSGALVWQYDLKIADAVAVTGKVAPGGNWQHQIKLDVNHLDPLLQKWGVPTTYGAHLTAHWDGQLSSGKLAGSLTIDRATASKVPTLGEVSLSGSVDAESDGSTLTVHPHQLLLTTALVTLPEVGIDAGSIVSDTTGLHAQSLKLRALGGLARVDGNVDPHTSAVDLHASWSGLSLASSTTQSGSLTASLREPFNGQPVIMAELDDTGAVGGPTTAGTASSSRWSAKLNLTGQGKSWSAIDWVLTAPQLQYIAGGESIDLSQLSAHVSQRLPVVELTSLSLPANSSASGTTPVSLSSSGRIDFHSLQWNFDLAGGFNTSFQNTAVPVNLTVHARGDNRQYNLKSLVLGVSDLAVSVDGSYDNDAPNPATPVDLHVVLSQTPRIAPDAPVQGEVSGEFKIVGALFREQNHFRPYLTTTGDLRSSDLVVFNRPVGDVDIKLRGITETPMLPDGQVGPSITQIHTVDFYLLQAPWDLSIAYPNVDGNLEAVLQAHRLSLEDVGKFAKVNGVTGQVVEASCTAVLPTAEISRLYLHSEMHLADVNAAGLTADAVDVKLTLRDGLLRLNPLVARSGAGTVTTTASVDVQNPRQMTIETTVRQWPYNLSAAVSAVVSAHSNLSLDLKAKDLAASGAMTASTDLLLGRTRLAHADVEASVLNRAVNLDKLSGNILNGTFTGGAKVDIDRPLTASGQVMWENVDGAALATVFPALEGFGGKFSGTLTLAPSRDPRPLEPVRMDLTVASVGGHFRSMQIGGDALLAINAVGYLNADRMVLDQSDIYVAGGVMHIWARARVRAETGLATQATVDFKGLQLDQLAHIDQKLTAPIPGVLSGQIGVIRTGSHATQVLAQAHVNLDQTDLGNFGPIASLYGLMHVGSKPNSGQGAVDLAFEQSTLRVTNFRYFNQGIEAHGLATLGPVNYDNLLTSNVSGQVVGTARPLKDTKLPFLGDFDTVFSAFQGNLTTILIAGKLDKPTYTQGLVSDINRTLRLLLVGDAEQTKTTKDE